MDMYIATLQKQYIKLGIWNNHFAEIGNKLVQDSRTGVQSPRDEVIFREE